MLIKLFIVKKKKKVYITSNNVYFQNIYYEQLKINIKQQDFTIQCHFGGESPTKRLLSMLSLIIDNALEYVFGQSMETFEEKIFVIQKYQMLQLYVVVFIYFFFVKASRMFCVTITVISVQ